MVNQGLLILRKALHCSVFFYALGTGKVRTQVYSGGLLHSFKAVCSLPVILLPSSAQ